MTSPAPHITLTTATNPGAVAIIQLHGEGIVNVLGGLTGTTDWPQSRLRYVKLADVDEGCVVRLAGRCGPCAQIMPHGGPRVVQKLVDHLVQCGCVYSNDLAARDLYPEAASDLEADMLATISRAASPAAIDLLAAQPALWQSAVPQGIDAGAILRRAEVLDRLIDSPSVVVVGRANVGKSTLTNRLLGKQVSLVADLPGTTRDWVAGLVELGAPGGDVADGVAVRWLDTPGLRDSEDPIEQRAISMARQVVADADVLLAMRDRLTDWPDLPGAADLWLINKVDDGPARGSGRGSDDPLAISAATGFGLDRLQHLVLQALGLGDTAEPTLWAFTDVLRSAVASNNRDALQRYVT